MPNIKQAEIQYAAAAKPLQLCPTLCDPIDGSPPGSPVPGILQARTLEWVAISFSNALKWSRSVLSNSWRPHVLQPTRLLHPWDFPGKSTGVGCHCLLFIQHFTCQFCYFGWQYQISNTLLYWISKVSVCKFEKVMEFQLSYFKS